VEGLRSKLKRLAVRGWLAEEPGGLSLPAGRHSHSLAELAAIEATSFGSGFGLAA
jgi:hypothetical protein